MSVSDDRIMRRLTERALGESEARSDAASEVHSTDGKRRQKCVECGHRWPCRTYRILQGGES